MADNQNVSAEETLKAELEALQAENEALKNARPKPPPRKLTCKPSQKGGMSVYGLGRWPVTLYGSQWKFLLENINTVKDHLEAFDAANLLREKE